jgi:hypothetical protein
MGQASLPGVVDAIGFGDQVLAQRDRVAVGAVERTPLAATEVGAETSLEVLKEIRDSLKRMEQKSQGEGTPAP